MNRFKLAQDDEGNLYVLNDKQTGSFTYDTDIYNIDGKQVESTFYTDGWKAKSEMMEKYHVIPTEMLELFFIDINICFQPLESMIRSKLFYEWRDIV